MNLIFFIALLIFAFPTLNIGGVPIRGEDLVFIGIILFSKKGSFGGIFGNQEKAVYPRLLFLFFISNVLSLCFSILNGYGALVSDLNSLFFYLRGVIIISSGLILGTMIEVKSYNRLLLSLTFSTFISSVVSIIQYFDIAGMGERLYLIFGKEKEIMYGITRVVGIFGNPNYAAFFQLFGYASLLCLKDIKNPVYAFLRIFMIVLTGLSIIITFSRTGFISLILISLFYLGITKQFKTILVAGLVAVVYILPNFKTLMSNTRFSVILESNEAFDATMGGRTNLIWEKQLDHFLENPLFGIGPYKGGENVTDFGNTTFDNSIIFTMVTSGLIGLLLIVVFYFKAGIYFLRRLNGAVGQMSLFITLMNFSTLLFLITTDVIKNPAFTTFFYFLIGLMVSYSIKKESSI